MRRIIPTDIKKIEEKENGFLYLGKRCELFRTNCVVSRAQMAEAIGVTIPSLYHFETTGNIRGQTLSKFLEVLYYKFGVNPAYILFEKNEAINPFISIEDTSPEHIISMSKQIDNLKKRNKELVAENKELEIANKLLFEKVSKLIKEIR